MSILSGRLKTILKRRLQLTEVEESKHELCKRQNYYNRFYAMRSSNSPNFYLVTEYIIIAD